MRLYAVNDAGEFIEYRAQGSKDEHREKTMEDWLEANPDCVVEDGGLLLIGRQVSTNLGGHVDLLAVDREGDVAVIELKRDRTPRETLAQALEYASFASGLDYEQLQRVYQDYTGDEATTLAEAHREYFQTGDDEAVSFNKDQRIVIVGGEIAPVVRETSIYLRKRGLRVTCLEFAYFQTHAGEQLLSIDTAVGRESVKGGPPTTESLPRTTRNLFLDACDEAGRKVLEPVLALADEEGLPVHWGSRAFSLNVDVDGQHVGLALAFPRRSKPREADQSLRVTFGEVRKKLPGCDSMVEEFYRRFDATGLFAPAGARGDIRYWINELPAAEQVEQIISLLRDLASAVREHARQ